MVQAMVHRATHVWVVEEQELVGVVGLLDVLRVLRHHLVAGSGCGMHPDLD
jgi:CBS domain-containing protein